MDGSTNTQFYWAIAIIITCCLALFWIVGYEIQRAPRYLFGNARWIITNALLILAAVHAILLAPPPPPATHCAETLHVSGPLYMVLSCDSKKFVSAAREPRLLLTYRWWNQARPLAPMAASLLTLAESADPDKQRSILGRPYGVPSQPGWLPYVVFNFVLLLVALMLFKRFNAPGTITSSVATITLSTFLVVNDVVKGFFWSAHTQMWNVLMPLICIALSYSFLRQPVRSWGFMIALGLLLGIGFLVYGSLIVCTIAVIVAVAVGLRLNRDATSRGSLVVKLLLFLVAFAAPALVWITIVNRTVGFFFSPEAEIFRQFVWVWDGWLEGGVGGIRRYAQTFFLQFTFHFANVLWPALILLAIVLVIAKIYPAQIRETIQVQSLTLGAAGITLGVCLIFFGLMGFYRNRLEFNIVAPVLVIASVLISGVVDRLPRKQSLLTMTVVILAAIASIGSALMRVTWPY